LRHRLNRRIGATGIATAWSARVFLAALASAGVGYALKIFVRAWHPILQAVVVLSGFALMYQLLTMLFHVSELDVLTRFTRRIGHRRDGRS
jgi:thiol:disulfide interchange protein